MFMSGTGDCETFSRRQGASHFKPRGVVARKEALQTMQSSIAAAVRALIMLACVVGIMAAALSGTSWTEILTKLQDFRWPAVLNLASASPSPSPSEAPRFGPAHAAADTSAAGQSQKPWVSATPAKIPETSLARQEQSPAATRSAVVPVEYQAPAENAAESGPFSADPYRKVQERLRQLGATYYLLESWGNQQQQYRFYCKIAVGGNPDYTHYFEATDSDPLQTMRQVLSQVETWRAGG
jgi:hypothetical protein